jgi:hypothetical protein
MTERGGAALKGVIYSFGDGLPQFAQLVKRAGPVGSTVGILGNGFATASSVTFNGSPASFHVVSNTFMTASVPAGETGYITVTTSTGTRQSNSIFKVTPKVTALTPGSGKANDTVIVTGTGLIQTEAITVGKGKVTNYTVNSDAQLTITVPATATTGKISVTTPGGKASSSVIFTVNP